jgi:hypothetical protein
MDLDVRVPVGLMLSVMGAPLARAAGPRPDTRRVSEKRRDAAT